MATLTFEQIVEAHKKYYHPQNSVIYLYGDVDYQKALKTIDKDFLSHFKRDTDFKSPSIPVQTNFDYPTPVVEATYPGQKGSKKDFLSYGFVIGSQLTPVEENALNVLVSAFIDNDASPVKLRLLKEGLAQSTFSMNVGGDDNGLAFVFEGSDKTQQEKIKQVIDEELKKVAQEGMDPELLNSILNKYEFSFKEKNSNGSHRGLQMAFLVLDNWTYKSEPLKESLDFVSQFKELRTVISSQDYIKSFFQKNFVDNTKKRWVILQPDPDFSQKFNAGLDRQVEEALKEKPIDAYINEQKEYEAWVAAKESDEILEKTPTLKISDINDDEKPIEYVSTKSAGTEVIQYPQDTSGIAYINLYFDLSGISQDRLKNIELFKQMIRKTDTTNIGFKDLSKQIDTSIGGLGFSVSTNQSSKDPQKFKPTLEVGLSFLLENREKTFSLLKEIMTESQFTPIDRVSNLIDEMKTGMASSISSRAPSLSASAATKAFYPKLGAFNDEISGANFESFMSESTINPEALSTELKRLLKDIFNQKRMYLATVTASNDDLKVLTTEVAGLQNSLPKEGSTDQAWDFSQQASFDGFIIPGEVQYVSQASSFIKHMEFHGSMLVYARYLNNNYMTPKLREQAGAYGGGASFSRSGLFTMTTYRDPNLQKSLDIFAKALDFMKNEKFTADKLRPAILGSLKPYYSDKSVAAKADFMTGLYLTEQTWDDYLKIKKEILSTDSNKIEQITTALEKSLDQLQKAVAGNAQKIKTEGTFLKKTLVIK